MLKKRKILAIALLSIVLLDFLPTLQVAGKSKITFYFHEVSENYLQDIGSIGTLNKNFPSKKNISDAAKGTYSMEDVLEISGDMIFDLYFNVPLVNISPDIVDRLINLSMSFANFTQNLTVGNLTLSNISNLIKIIFENLTKVNWSEFRREILNLSLGREEKFLIKVMDGNKLLKEKVIAVKNTPKNALELNLSLLLSPKKWKEMLSERNVKHVTFTLKGVMYKSKQNIGTALIMIEAEDELAWIREVLSKIGKLNASAIIELLTNLGLENVTKKENLIKIAVSFFNILKPLLESIFNVSFVYDSCNFPSSLTITGTFVERKERGERRYFLRNEIQGGKPVKILSENPPLYGEESYVNLSSKAKRWILLQPFKHLARIHGNVTICLYIDYPSYKERLSNGTLPMIYKIEASLVELGEDMKKVATIGKNTTSVIAMLAGNATCIELKNIDHVIEVNHTIALDVKWNIWNITEDIDIITGTKPKLRYNCTEFPSYVEMTLTDPDDIKMKLESPFEQKILRSGQATFKINLTNKGKGKDTVNITLWLIDLEFAVTPSGWNCTVEGLEGLTVQQERNIKYIKGKVDVGGEESAYIIVNVVPPTNAEYGKRLALYVNAKGERGKDNLTCYIQLSEELRIFNVEIIKPNGSKVRVGKSHTYTFVVKNAGNDRDTFLINANSSNNWKVSINPTEVELAPNESSKINVTIYVPSNAGGKEDILTFMVISETNPSDKNSTCVITTAFIPPVNQLIAEFFDSAAKITYLDRVFGPSAGTILMTIFFLVVVAIVLALIYTIKRKFVELICLDRIREVEPGKEAKYSITLRNPTRKRLTYEVSVNEDILPEGWKIEIPQKEISLDPSEEKEIDLIVKPTSEVDPEGWAEVQLRATPIEKPKPSAISLLAIVKGAKPKLRITGVFHWPKIFKAGDTITTRFTLRNDGNVTARDLSVILSVNGIEKNRVDNVTIPSGGYAEIKLPWIATKGKNRVRIIVKRERGEVSLGES